MPIVLHCHKGIGAAVTGTALVAKDNFSARYDLDRKSGTFSRPSHTLAGQSYVGKILVLDTALVFNRVNPILAQGAAFGGVTMVDRFEGDVTELIQTGDELRIDPEAGTVEILNR
jgi:uncharacterized protein